jgi:hypothetical protein
MPTLERAAAGELAAPTSADERVLGLSHGWHVSPADFRRIPRCRDDEPRELERDEQIGCHVPAAEMRAIADETAVVKRMLAAAMPAEFRAASVDGRFHALL